MRPADALSHTGKRLPWVAQQMGVSRSYLWRLLKGQRQWRPDLRRTFALALGLSEDAVDYCAPCVGSRPTDDTPQDNAEALDPSPERAATPSEYSATSERGNGL